jgi:NADH:ubiquinone oxidoreductase subunit D
MNKTFLVINALTMEKLGVVFAQSGARVDPNYFGPNTIYIEIPEGVNFSTKDSLDDIKMKIEQHFKQVDRPHEYELSKTPEVNWEEV